MFEEAQLLAPVTTAEHGSVTVHVAEDDPGLADPGYRARRNHIASLALAWERGMPIPPLDHPGAAGRVAYRPPRACGQARATKPLTPSA